MFGDGVCNSSSSILFLSLNFIVSFLIIVNLKLLLLLLLLCHQNIKLSLFIVLSCLDYVAFGRCYHL